MIVLDTTVLVCAKGAEHELRESCRSMVAAIAAETLEDIVPDTAGVERVLAL